MFLFLCEPDGKQNVGARVNQTADCTRERERERERALIGDSVNYS